MFEGYAQTEVMKARICIEKRVVRGKGNDRRVVVGERDDEETVGG